MSLLKGHAEFIVHPVFTERNGSGVSAGRSVSEEEGVLVGKKMT